MNETSDEAMLAFYAGMSEVYDLLLDDWDDAVARQGEVLDALLRHTLGRGPRRVLDAACGIGTQAIGLALRGHQVVGTDLSAPALARAEREAARLGAALATREADLRTLSTVVRDRFDAVVVLDNAVAHLQTQADVDVVVRELTTCLEPDGLLLVSVRDYDRLRVARPQLTSERLAGPVEARRIAFQVWDWAADGEHYGLRQYLVRHRGPGVEALVFQCRVRAIMRTQLEAAFAVANLGHLAWLEPKASGFYQPILAGRRPSST